MQDIIIAKQNSFSNFGVLLNFVSSVWGSGVASPIFWNWVWDTASRSKKRQDTAS